MTDFVIGLSALLSGLLSGSFLLEGRVLVPYWKRMPAQQFRALHHTLGPHLYRYFAPLIIATVVASIVAGLLHGRAFTCQALATLAVLIQFAGYPLYFKATMPPSRRVAWRRGIWSLDSYDGSAGIQPARS